MKGKNYILALIGIVAAVHAWSQTPPRQPGIDSLEFTPGDTIPPVATGQENYKRSGDALEAEAKYRCQDSMYFDNIKGEWHMWGDAVVEYTTLSVTADYIVFNVDSNIATAQAWPDANGELQGFPVFKEGQREFEAHRMRYNFQSGKGMVYDVVTKEGDLVVHGERTKFVTADSTAGDDVIYNEGALITTCTHPEPHYGIRSKKIKTIPNRLAVIGPSNIELQGVPTPLWLPFGFFPVTSTRKAGLIFPDSYEYSEAWGFGLRGVGYYMPINDYMDASLLADIYFNGSWGLRLHSNYRKRYDFNGSFDIGYSYRKTEIVGEVEPSIEKSFSLRASHTQAAQAHPYRSMGGSINIQSNDYTSFNNNDANSALTNTFSSNFSWRRTFPGQPFSLSVGLSHSQNTNTHLVTINAPEVDFRLNRIYPFKRKKVVGREKWYERVGFQYSGNSRTRFTTTDTTIISQETWQNAQSGVQHKANADLSFSVFKYLNFTPQISYEEIWFFKTQEKDFLFDPSTDVVIDTIYGPGGEEIITLDTISYGDVMDTLVRGFTPYRHFTTGISLNTQLFMTIQSNKGFFRGFRHVLKPTFSYSYEPDNSYYLESVPVDIRDTTATGPMDEYSIFEGGVYSARIVQGERSLLSYSFNNIFEAKFFSKRDTSVNKMKLLDNLVIGGNYNFAADSLQWSQVNIRGTMRMFKQATTFSFGAAYDPYDVDETGKRINEFYWNTQRKPLRFVNLQLRFATTLTVQKVKEIFGLAKPGDRGRGSQRGRGPQQDKFFDIFEGLSLNHNFVMTRTGLPGKDVTMINTHTINVRGNLKLTPKWTVSVGNIGFDFRSGQITYPDITFVRDLHCWDLRFSWQPQRGTYSLHIGVKPGSLDFLKIPSQRNNQNADQFGGF